MPSCSTLAHSSSCHTFHTLLLLKLPPIVSLLHILPPSYPLNFPPPQNSPCYTLRAHILHYGIPFTLLLHTLSAIKLHHYFFPAHGVHFPSSTLLYAVCCHTLQHSSPAHTALAFILFKLLSSKYCPLSLFLYIFLCKSSRQILD